MIYLAIFEKLPQNIVMKRRLRKKKRLGEFVEWGTLVRAKLSLKGEEELDAFSDLLIEKVEEVGCFCGGGISLDRGLDLVLELGQKKKLALERLAFLESWLASHPCVSEVEISGAKHSGSVDKIFDLWHEEPIGVEY